MPEKSTLTAVSSRILRLVLRFKMPLMILGLLAGLGLLIFLCKLTIGSLELEVSDWLSGIEDPNERGMAYVSLSIVGLSVVIAFKDFKPNR